MNGRSKAMGVRGLVMALGLLQAALAPAQPPVPDPALAGLREGLGLGYRLGDSGFNLGGYAEAAYASRDGEQPWRLALNALSGILWWDGGGRWRFLMELELEDGLVVQPGDTTTDTATPVLERFHVDYAYGDRWQLRLGKFLTPIGRWNLIHAAPLTWTTSRPLITEATFPTNATGAMVHGVLPWTADGIEYALYVSPGEELFAAKDIDTFREALGLRLATSLLPDTQFGISFASFEQESTPDRKTLYGLDFRWAWRRYELSGELAYRTRDFGEDQIDEHGHYLQAVAPLSARLFAVARYENFHASNAAHDINRYLAGLTFRPLPAFALKAEYARMTDDRMGRDDTVRASVAVLF